MHGRRVDAGDRRQRLVQLVDRRLDARSDVVLPLPFGVRGREVRGDDVVDVDEVARLLAAAVDRRLLPVEQLRREDRHDARLAMRVLPRTVDVRVSQRDRRKSAHDAVVVQVVLDRELRAAVRRERTQSDAISVCGTSTGSP